jgi:alpha-galactosidase
MKSIFPWLLATSVCCGITLSLKGQSSSRIDLPLAAFITGDDLRYRDPAFPDSNWIRIRPTDNWENQGFEKYDGFVWYRFHFILPLAMKTQAWWPDTLRLYLGKIDDADEVYLNGQLIAKHGSFPSDPGGYVTQWNLEREIHLPSSDSLLHYDQENVLAIRVYDGDGPGGMFGPPPFVNMLDIHDGLKIRYEHGSVIVTNDINKAISGELEINVLDPANQQIVLHHTGTIELSSQACTTTPLSLDPGQRVEIRADFTDNQSGRSVYYSTVPTYILTPQPSSSPRINSPVVFGVRPGCPFLFRIAATGERPLRFHADQLPKGLKLDEATGIITGKLKKEGEYQVLFTVTNDQATATQNFTIKCGDLIALTPPMGWNSWNCWGLSVSDAKVRASAQAIMDKGLLYHGWSYINIDDGWESPQRDKKGEILSNTKFPDMTALGSWLHDKGLKLGVYSSPGPKTCGGYLGSYRHEEQDAATYTSWGVDYLKYDWCSYGRLHNEKDTSLASYIQPYAVMQKALRSQPRDIVYSLCQYGMKKVWTWGQQVDGNCWRTTGDIDDSWESMFNIAFHQVDMQPYAQPGRWNDPDMLIVGQVGWGDQLHPTRLTADEQYTHISLWCLLAAPLLIGCDISSMDDFTLNLLTNDEVIAIDQDAAGIQAKPMIQNEDYQVWMKPLADGSYAIGIFNIADDYRSIDFPFRDLGLNDKYKVRDVWRQRDLGTSETLSAKVPPHGVMLVVVRELEP